MQTFIPREKLSKKARQQLAKAQRKSWTMNPVTRVVKNEKLYNRKRIPKAQVPDGIRFFLFAALSL